MYADITQTRSCNTDIHVLMDNMPKKRVINVLKRIHIQCKRGNGKKRKLDYVRGPENDDVGEKVLVLNRE